VDRIFSLWEAGMTTFDLLLATAGVPVLLAAGYLLLLTLLWRKPAQGFEAPGSWRFVILVPAHDEERGIGATIASLGAIDYPKDRFRVVVVADNCSDRTAEAAAASGAQVIERHDVARRGKGHALRHAIERLLDEETPWDALAVVDADTVVSANFLTAIAARLEAGAEAVQAAYMPSPGTGSLSVITEVAFSAFHLLRSTGRERLGLSSGLRGNGMAFRRTLLSRVPHDAFSRTEDLEFGVRLALAGIPVAFAAGARVYGEMPDRAAAARPQRERWIGGRVGIARKYAAALVAGAIRRRSAMLGDVAVDLLIPPLSVLAVVSALGLAAAAGVAALDGGVASLAVFSAAAAALSIHVAVAARVAGRGAAFTRAALALPRYALGKAAITARALAPSEEIWIRTQRKGERG